MHNLTLWLFYHIYIIMIIKPPIKELVQLHFHIYAMQTNKGWQSDGIKKYLKTSLSVTVISSFFAVRMMLILQDY